PYRTSRDWLFAFDSSLLAHGFRMGKGRAQGSSNNYLFRSNCAFAACNCFRSSGLTVGYASFRSFKVSTTAAATTRRVYHLLSAGTTYQGACLLEVATIISS